ncbi:hypothetical protein GCM10007884_51660 [Methylobacterium brachythecii]|uniref:Uncharacterized protein n=1 Tax=Methylobacterium brachythecii TaxID=1176177 RepID=A0ABQ6DBU9_9HYPH|nr:hypothetical protein GCM10007884_51660 [Methylobacterium brachythecii]
MASLPIPGRPSPQPGWDTLFNPCDGFAKAWEGGSRLFDRGGELVDGFGNAVSLLLNRVGSAPIRVNREGTRTRRF